MPSASKRVQVWQNRVEAANKAFDDWASDYEVDRGYEYWKGNQHEHLAMASSKEEEYTINLFFPTIETKKPTMMFFRPIARITPKPARADDLGSTMPAQARLMEDTARTFMWDRRVGFKFATNLALSESFFKFGILEVGFTANYIDNPNAHKPVLDEDGKEIRDSEGLDIKGPEKVPKDETMYVRRIPASQFRVSASNRNRLIENDWCGYYEWVFIEDVRRNEFYNSRARNKLKAKGKSLETRSSESLDNDLMGFSQPDMVKIWKIWDIRGMKKIVFADGDDDFLREGDPIPFLPFADLKLHEILDSYYPLPFVYNLLSPQNEYNETRQGQKIHRRRYHRRYLARKNFADQEEIDKLQDGGDGTIVFVNGNPTDVMLPVPDAPLDGAVWRNIPATKDDFNTIASVGGEARGINEAETATQANIMDTNAKIRDNFQQTLVGDWLSKVVWLMIETFRAKMSLPQIISVNVDLGAPGAPMEAMRVAESWKQLTFKELGSLDFDVDIDISSLSPINDDIERRDWSAMLQLFANPAIMMVLTASEVMLKKTMRMYNIRSDEELREIRGAMVASLVGMGMMGGGAGGGVGAGPGAGMPRLGQGATPGPAQGALPEAIASQMSRILES